MAIAVLGLVVGGYAGYDYELPKRVRVLLGAGGLAVAIWFFSRL